MMKKFNVVMIAVLGMFMMADASALNPRRVFKKKCASCHTIGQGVKKAPDLVDLETRKGNEWVVKFLTTDSKHDVKKYKGEKLAQILEYIYTKGAGSDKDIKNEVGNIKAGRMLSITCVTCHGPAGYSRNPEIPHLRGQQAKYIMIQLRAYRDGTRIDKDETMSTMAKALSDRDIVNLATYYGELNN